MHQLVDLVLLIDLEPRNGFGQSRDAGFDSETLPEVVITILKAPKSNSIQNRSIYCLPLVSGWVWGAHCWFCLRRRPHLRCAAAPSPRLTRCDL